MTGETDRPLDLTGQLLATPSELSSRWLALDPRWKSLRGHARFEALLRDNS